MILSFLLTISTLFAAETPQVRIGVIDSGLDRSYAKRLCATGHKSFVKGESWSTEIDMRHGTNVVTLIEAELKSNTSYCLVIVKVFGKNGSSDAKSLSKAMEYVSTLKLDVVNISAGGEYKVQSEMVAALKLVNSGTIVISSAGNLATNLDQYCNFFPACYDSRIIIVGALDKNGRIWSQSNYSNRMSNMVYATGVNMTGGGVTLSGSSQATAVFTGKLVNYMIRNRVRRSVQSLSNSDVQKIVKAIAIQSGVDKKVGAYFKYLQTYVPEEIELGSKAFIPLYKMMVEKRITVGIRF